MLRKTDFIVSIKNLDTPKMLITVDSNVIVMKIVTRTITYTGRKMPHIFNQLEKDITKTND